MSPNRRARHLALAGIASLALVSAWIAPGQLVAPAAAASGLATFGKPTADSSFTAGVTFSQPVTINQDVGRVELVLTVASAPGPTVIEVPAPDGTGPRTLTHLVDPSVDGHLLPNTPLSARWRLTGADDPAVVELGPEVRITYADDRFKWRTEAGPLVSVHWYEGSDAFGTRALKVAEDGVRRAADLLQVTETDPVDFYVYADQQAFYDALGPGTRENVGGQASGEIRTLFALIPTDEIDQPWVGIVIPHELTHLVFNTAASNPYHFPPHWLNEGLAVDLSQGYDSSDRGAVEAAAGSGTLIPLDGLIGQFPTSFDRFTLAYAESVSAVDYLIRVHGRDQLVTLIRSYAQGRTDDEAFTAALGLDLSAFGAAWLEDLGAAAPTRFGPQPALPGPVPPGWLVAAGGSSQPGGSSGAAAASGQPSSNGGESASDGGGALVVVLVLVVAVIFLVAVVIARRRRTGLGTGGWR